MIENEVNAKLALTLLPLLAVVLAAACGGESKPRVPAVAPSPTLEVSLTPEEAEPILADIPANLGGFLAQFGGNEEVAILCAYDADTALVRCGETGLLYELQDGLVAAFDRCELWQLDGVAVYLACIVDEPAQRVIYAIPPTALP